MQQGISSGGGQADRSNEDNEVLPILKQIRLGLSRNYYSMAGVLGLKRIHDYFQVHDLLPHRHVRCLCFKFELVCKKNDFMFPVLQGSPFILASRDDVWILGEKYVIPVNDAEKQLQDQVEICTEFGFGLFIAIYSVFIHESAGAQIIKIIVQVMSKLLMDYASRLWMTYRKGFPPLGAWILYSG